MNLEPNSRFVAMASDKARSFGPPDLAGLDLHGSDEGLMILSCMRMKKAVLPEDVTSPSLFMTMFILVALTRSG